jgi:AcrR family transcriptional regulator
MVKSRQDSPDTRTTIVDTAVRLFEERGYAATTMRAIATEAGLAPSNAYYWFASKDELVQEFYRRIQVAHRDRSAEALAAGGTLVERLRAVEDAFFEVMGPHHGFGAAFVGTAVAPGASVSPFSEASAQARELSRAIFRDVVEGASPGVPAKLATVLPDLLWLAHLSITLFWVMDTSPGQERTRTLVDRAIPLLSGAVRVARLPGAAGLVGQVGGVLDVVMPGRRP